LPTMETHRNCLTSEITYLYTKGSPIKFKYFVVEIKKKQRREITIVDVLD